MRKLNSTVLISKDNTTPQFVNGTTTLMELNSSEFNSTVARRINYALDRFSSVILVTFSSRSGATASGEYVFTCFGHF